MKKTETKINITDFPKELHYLLDGATIYDSSSHPTMTTLYSDYGYYIKYAEKGALKKDAELGKLFDNFGMGVEVVAYLSEDTDYFLELYGKENVDMELLKLVKKVEEQA